MLRAGLYELNVMSCQVDLSMELPPKERFMNDALQYAVQTNNIERVEMLLNQGVDITWKCQVSELSPLQSALKLEHIKIFKLLLDHGANAVEFFFWMVDLDAKDIAILKVVQNHPEILTYLFEHDVLPGTNAYWQEWAAFVDVLTHLSSNSTVDLEKLYKVLLSCVMVCPSQNEKSVELQGHQFVKCTHLDLRLVLLFNAIESKSVSCVNLLLQHGVPVNILGPDMKNGCLYDETPLHRACRYDSIEIVKVLLKNGAKFVCCEEALTPLDVAYNELSVEIMWLFVANGYTSESIKSYKLNVACLLQEVDLVRELIDDGADVNKFDHKGRMPLIMAIYVKNMALFKLLLKAGALPYMPCFHKPNPCTGLHCPANSVRRAVEYKNAEALDCLLDILCEDIPLTKRFSDSSRLLVNAITSGDYKTFDVLMKRGADCVSRVYDGFAPIHIAAHEGDVSMLKALVERGVCVNDNAATKKHVHVRDERCEKKEKYCCIDFEEVDHRPLFLTKSAECIRFLLEKGADIHSVGCEGYLRDVLAEDGKFLDELTPRHRARILTTYRDKIGPGTDGIKTVEPCPPYVKIIETGSLAAMKAYFSSQREKLCPTPLMFETACRAGKYEHVRYLISQTPSWLRMLHTLHLMFTKPSFESHFQSILLNEQCDWIQEGRVKEDPICYIKMVGMLLDLGCTFDFRFWDEENIDVEEDNLPNFEGDVNNYDLSHCEDKKEEHHEGDREGELSNCVGEINNNLSSCEDKNEEHHEEEQDSELSNCEDEEQNGCDKVEEVELSDCEDEDEDEWSDDSEEEEEKVRNHPSTPQEIDDNSRSCAACILNYSYDSQRFVFAKLLQEMCGRCLRIDCGSLLCSMLVDRDYDMVQLLLNCGHKIYEESFAELVEQISMTKHDYQGFTGKVEEMQCQPLGLQSLCRTSIRSVLFRRIRDYSYINNTIKKLPLPKPIIEYLSFSGKYELSYLMYASEDPYEEHKAWKRPEPNTWQNPFTKKQQRPRNLEDEVCCVM